MKNNFRKVIFINSRKILIIMVFVFLSLLLVGCDLSKAGTDDGVPPDDSGNLENNELEIKESFTGIQFNTTEISDLQITEAQIEELVANNIYIKDASCIDIQIVEINDEFVHLAYDNFKEYYGVDFDWKQFLKDIAIGATVVIVYVALSTVAGPVGTFFGAVIASEFAIGALAVGAAIDAAVAGYQAYKEGGDLTYILGHMLNGVGDGLKWGAILAPLSFGVGELVQKGVQAAKGAINGMRAAKKASKLAGLASVPTDKVKTIIHEFSKISKQTAGLAADASDVTLSKLFKKMQSEFSEELTEDLFIKAFRNKNALMGIIKQYNPYNIATELLESARDNFVKKAGCSDDTSKEFIKKMKNKSIKNLNDVAKFDNQLLTYMKNNVGEFLESYGSLLSKDILDELVEVALLKVPNIENLGVKNVISAIKKNIATGNNAYCNLIEVLDKNVVDSILNDYDSLLLLQLRYGTKNTNRLIQVRKIFNAAKSSSKSIDDAEVILVVKNILSGKTKSLANISNKQIISNLNYNREIIMSTLKNLNLGSKTTDLVDELIIYGLKNSGELSSAIATNPKIGDLISDFIVNNLSKSEIITKYGNDGYEFLIKNSLMILESLKSQGTVNKKLMKDILSDVLLEKKIPQNAIDAIVKGCSVSDWGLSNAQIYTIANLVASYYQGTNAKLYSNFILENAEIRASFIKEFIDEYTSKNSIINSKYANSIMELPDAYSTSQSQLLKDMYGDVMMSSSSNPIFEDYAIFRYESSNLTGLNGGMDDIALANMAHHGTKVDPVGYTWHHLEDGKTLILIPSDLHEAYRHTGGADFLRENINEYIEKKLLEEGIS